MIDHAAEVIDLLLWALLVGGAMFLALARWIAAQLLKKLDGIESAIHELGATQVRSDATLRGELVALERRHEHRIVDVERRVSDLHTRCAIFHEHDKD